MLQRALCWIRRDLRLSDHAALAAATERAEQVAVVFVFDARILGELHDRDDKRVTFIHRSLAEIDDRLRGLGSRLIVLHGDPVDEIPALAERLDAQAVFCSRDYEPYAIGRDRKVSERLTAARRELVQVKDTVIFEGHEVLSQQGEPFRVYSPYRKAWLARFRAADAAEHRPDLNRLWRAHHDEPELHPLESIGFVESELWLLAGESGAKSRLEWFGGRMDEYAAKRDFPVGDNTSGISVHLRFGTVSIRECVRAALERPTRGAEKWLHELLWREYYFAILDRFPYVVNGAFKPEYDAVDWPGTEDQLQAWCEGQTGYPIVDAAMRCFNETGWMHNRLRMVVAMFLTKDLLVHWQRGEAYFARKLLDFDLANNNGGWQWSASTGADAQPYFRIFNPVFQSAKFDPEGAFIKEWIPELRDMEAERIHWPHSGGLFGSAYAPPIVEHATQRELALELLASVKR